MRAELQIELINIAQQANWKHQSVLTAEEDKIVGRHWPFVVSELTDPVKRYLQLGSIPYIITKPEMIQDAEKKGREILQEVWHDEWPNTEMVKTLVRRPHNPSGNLEPKYMVIGDAPGVGDGAVFDRVERMFTRGPSSHMLRHALIFANLYYDVWFTNLLRLSTPSNRPSFKDEVLDYKHFLLKEIQLLKPQRLILLGAHVEKMFLSCYKEITIPTVKIYHPSYVSRICWNFKEYAEFIQSKV